MTHGKSGGLDAGSFSLITGINYIVNFKRANILGCQIAGFHWKWKVARGQPNLLTRKIRGW